MTIFFGAIVVLFPPAACAYLYKNFDKLETPETQSKIGSLYSEEYIRRGRGVLITLVIFFSAQNFDPSLRSLQPSYYSTNLRYDNHCDGLNNKCWLPETVRGRLSSQPYGDI
jgi:hypothetical protein